MTQSSKIYETNTLVLRILYVCVRDYQIALNDPLFCIEIAEFARTSNITKLRAALEVLEPSGTIAEFKAMYQVKTFLKRYRFSDDVHSEDALVEKALTGFLNIQDKLKSFNYGPDSVRHSEILRAARSFVKKLLGPYDPVAHLAGCRFGSHASVGVPKKLACEAARWEPGITGTLYLYNWFRVSYMGNLKPHIINRMRKHLKARNPDHRKWLKDTDALKMFLVPKSFKALRSVMPNTTLGTLYTSGIGSCFEHRLRSFGLDLKTLQKRHKDLARIGSLNGKYVTADQSSASDNISVALVRLLLPSDWFKVLNDARHKEMSFNNQKYGMETFCTMGIGYTTTLQMIVFLSLLHALDKVFKCHSDVISVYGDDMIYSPSLHTHVLSWFPRFGLVINKDKTFAEGNFRESCGGDYYHGADVRPFQPEGSSQIMSPRVYEATLYKMINGFLRRWSEFDIPLTLKLLKQELYDVTEAPFLVPLDFPDDSGIQWCEGAGHFVTGESLTLPKSVGNGLYRFKSLSRVTDLEVEGREEPYLWRWYGGHTKPERSYSGTAGHDCTPVQHRINDVTGVSSTSTPLLVSKKKGTGCVVVSMLSGRVVEAREAHVIRETDFVAYEVRRSVSDFRDRREATL